jgi:methylglyoxal synthase
MQETCDLTVFIWRPNNFSQPDPDIEELLQNKILLKIQWATKAHQNVSAIKLSNERPHQVPLSIMQ